jgi:arylsulfatase A-like enzyme
MINSNFKLAMLGLIALPVFSYAKDEKQVKPNVLFIAIDDLKPILGCYGNPLVKTPNIDRLASRGTVFMSNYCQQAVSGGSRSSLLTGMRPDYTQIWDCDTQIRDVHPDIVTLPHYFKINGYETSGIGKIFHEKSVIDSDPISWSIPYLSPVDRFSKITGQPTLYYYHDPITKARIEKYIQEGLSKGMTKNEVSQYAKVNAKVATECMDLPDNAYRDGSVALKAQEQIIALQKGIKPFFMAVGFQRPHLPFVSPKKYWNLYKRNEMPLAEFQQHAKNSPYVAYHRSDEFKRFTDIPEFCEFVDLTHGTGLKDINKQKELIHGYYAAVSYADAQVGILMNTLDSLGLINNTIIVLWGDHGWHLGDHDQWGKDTNFEESTRAPLIVSAPGLKSGKTKSITEFVDIFPTLCELTGLKTPQKMDGRSLVPLMKNVKAKVKEYGVSQYYRIIEEAEAKNLGYETTDVMGYTLRTERYRFTIWMANGFRTNKPFTEADVYATELYDYQKDPMETVSVGNEKEYNTVAKEMKCKMLQYFKSQEKIGPYKKNVKLVYEL